MRITKSVIMLMALVAFGMPNTLSAQVKVELTANGVKKNPDKGHSFSRYRYGGKPIVYRYGIRFTQCAIQQA